MGIYLLRFCFVPWLAWPVPPEFASWSQCWVRESLTTSDLNDSYRLVKCWNRRKLTSIRSELRDQSVWPHSIVEWIERWSPLATPWDSSEDSVASIHSVFFRNFAEPEPIFVQTTVWWYLGQFLKLAGNLLNSILTFLGIASSAPPSLHLLFS